MKKIILLIWLLLPVFLIGQQGFKTKNPDLVIYRGFVPKQEKFGFLGFEYIPFEYGYINNIYGDYIDVDSVDLTSFMTAPRSIEGYDMPNQKFILPAFGKSYIGISYVPWDYGYFRNINAESIMLNGTELTIRNTVSGFTEVNLNDYDDLQDCLEENQGIESIIIYVPDGTHIQKRSLNNFDTRARSGYDFADNITLIGESKEDAIIQADVGNWTMLTDTVTWTTSNTMNDTLYVMDNTGFSIGDEISIFSAPNELGGYPIYTTIANLVGTTKIVPSPTESWHYSNKEEEVIFRDSSYVTNLAPMITSSSTLTIKNLTIRGAPTDATNSYEYMIGWVSRWQVVHGLDVTTVDNYLFRMDNVLIKDFRFAESQTWGSAEFSYCRFENVGKGYHNSSVQPNNHISITNCDFIEINGFAAIYTCDSGAEGVFSFENNYFEDITISCISGIGFEPGRYGREARVRITNNTGINIGQTFIDAVPNYNHSIIVSGNTIENTGTGVRIRANNHSQWTGQLMWNSGWIVSNNVFTFKDYDSGILYAVSDGGGNNFAREGEHYFGGSMYYRTAITDIGVYVDSTKNIIINSNIIKGFEYGIDILEVDNVTITSNLITSNDSITSTTYPATFVEYDEPAIGVRLTTSKTTNLVFGLNNIQAVTDSISVTR